MHNLSQIWIRCKIRCFKGFPQKIIAKHRSLYWREKKHRTTIGPDGWPKIIAPIAMVRNGQKHRHRIVVIKKNIGIASLSKIDHRSSLWGDERIVWSCVNVYRPHPAAIAFSPPKSMPYKHFFLYFYQLKNFLFWDANWSNRARELNVSLKDGHCKVMRFVTLGQFKLHWCFDFCRR